VSGTSYADYLR
nr:RecName: Full=Unknown protein 4 [Pinus halepensis]